MFRKIPEQLVDMGSFWRHSLACALSARVLAKQQNKVNVERLFVAGLLHGSAAGYILWKH